MALSARPRVIGGPKCLEAIADAACCLCRLSKGRLWSGMESDPVGGAVIDRIRAGAAGELERDAGPHAGKASARYPRGQQRGRKEGIPPRSARTI